MLNFRKFDKLSESNEVPISRQTGSENGTQRRRQVLLRADDDDQSFIFRQFANGTQGTILVQTDLTSLSKSSNAAPTSVLLNPGDH